MLIVFEGIDGSGKTTQLGLIGDFLEKSGHQVVRSFEPTNGHYGTKLRQSATSGRLEANEELDLLIKDRKEHVNDFINPNLQSGKIVLLDRYYYSNIAYQGARGLNKEEIRDRNEKFAPKPDIVIHLKVDVNTALKRISKRDGKGNEFENFENLTKCAEVFSEIQEPDFFHIDGNRSIEEVHEEVRRLVMGWMM